MGRNTHIAPKDPVQTENERLLAERLQRVEDKRPPLVDLDLGLKREEPQEQEAVEA